MPTFNITDPTTGQSVKLTGDSPPTEQELNDIFSQVGQQGQQSQELSTQATPDQFLSPEQRLQTGFERDPQAKLEEFRAQRGLASGTPLEPTGFTLENLKDLPNDALDVIGPLLPAVGQLIGNIGGSALAAVTGGAALPLVAGAGVVGGGTGEAIRQEIGQKAFGLDQGTIEQRIGKIGEEAVLSAAGEATSLAINTSLKLVKNSLIKTGSKILKEGGLDKFNQTFGKIIRGMGVEEVKSAQELLRSGDKKILNAKFGTDSVAQTFSKRVLFGKGNKPISSHLQSLMKRSGKNDIEMKAFLKSALNNPEITDDVLNTIARKGSAIDKFNNQNVILKLGDDIKNAVVGGGKESGGILDEIGKQLKKERINLIKDAGKVKVSLEEINNQLIPDFLDIGLLRATKLNDEIVGYQLNKSFSITQTGKAQSKLFSPLIEKFFKKIKVKTVQPPSGKVLSPNEIARSGQLAGKTADEISDIFRNVGKSQTKKVEEKTFFVPKNEMSYGQFAKKLSNIDVQISGNEFKQIGQLSPKLTEYLQGIREIPRGLAEKFGNTSLVSLTDEFSEISIVFGPLREAISSNDKEGVEGFLRSIANPNALFSRMRGAEQINQVLKNKRGINLFDTLDNFKAAQSLKTYQSEFVKNETTKSLIGDMDSIFSTAKQRRLDFKSIKKIIDPLLPDNLKIGEFARLHSLSKTLNQSVESLLKASFISRFLPVGSTLSLASAGFVGGPGVVALTSVGGLVAGLLLQRPAVFKALLKAGASKKGIESFMRFLKRTPITKQLPKETGTVISQLLRSLQQ